MHGKRQRDPTDLTMHDARSKGRCADVRTARSSALQDRASDIVALDFEQYPRLLTAAKAEGEEA
jgi:hypothetical protein